MTDKLDGSNRIIVHRASSKAVIDVVLKYTLNFFEISHVEMKNSFDSHQLNVWITPFDLIVETQIN